MIFVDYAGSLIPVVAHSPWNGVHLADFVMPFFLFIVGVSVALVYKVYTYFRTVFILQDNKLFLMKIVEYEYTFLSY